MKKLVIFLLIAAPFLMDAQMTYVPDDNFEQALINLGLDTPPLNDSVPTKNIDTVTYLRVAFYHIYDLTGIEDFIDLSYFDCALNHLTSIDITKNTVLTKLYCYYNNLTNLDVSKNSALIEMYCYKNLDLNCIQVFDSAFSATNSKWRKDSTAHYSTDCGYTGVEVDKIRIKPIPLSPNPASDFIEIVVGDNHTLKGVVENVKIYNFLGEIVSGLDTPPNPLFLEGGICRIDVSGLAAGVYFVRVGDSVQRFVKY